LRPFEDQIYQFCLRWKKSIIIFDLVHLILKEKSHQDFLFIFLKKLAGDNYLGIEWKLHPFYTRDLSFLVHVRGILRDKLSYESTEEYPEHHMLVGILTARYGDEEILLAGLDSINYEPFLKGFLSEANYQNTIQITPAIHEKIMNIATKCLTEYHESFGHYSPCQCPLLAYVIRHSIHLSGIRDFSEIEKLAENDFLPVSLEVMIKRNDFDKEKIFQMMQYSEFDALKRRILQVWDILNQETKDILCEHRPVYNIYAKECRDTEFIEEVTKLFRRSEDVISAFDVYAEGTDISVAFLQLTAHWFFVDDFEEEIRTHGYHWMLQAALNTL
jgi:hypothetical protein